MANEIQVTASLTYTNAAKSIASKLLALTASLFSITGVNYVQGTMAAPITTPGALPLSGLASVGWGCFINHDTTHFVDVLTAAAGTAFARLKPGECALFRLTPAMTAPAVLADTAACEFEYLVLES